MLKLDEASGLLIYLKNLHPNERHFKVCRTQFWRIVQRHAAIASLPKRLAHPTSSKHSIAMQSIHSAGIENVRQYLCQKSLANTGADLKVDDETAAKTAGPRQVLLKNVDFQGIFNKSNNQKRVCLRGTSAFPGTAVGTAAAMSECMIRGGNQTTKNSKGLKTRGGKKAPAGRQSRRNSIRAQF